MVRKIQAKLVLRLHAQGLSGRAIARSQGMSRRSVSDVLDGGEGRRRRLDRCHRQDRRRGVPTMDGGVLNRV